MPRITRRGPVRRASADFRALSREQEDELTSGCGLLFQRGPAFRSPEDAAQAWALHRGRILRDWTTPFRRPRGFWLFEQAGEVPPTALDELLRLIELGELTSAELSELPGDLSPNSAREVIGSAGFDRLPSATRMTLVSLGGLLAGLTDLGVAHWIHELPGAVREMVLHRQAIDYDSLPSLPEVA